MPKVRTCLVALLVAGGAIWTALFPKTGDILHPDFVISAVIELRARSGQDFHRESLPDRLREARMPSEPSTGEGEGFGR